MREAKLASNLIEGMPIKRAAEEAGYAEGTARNKLSSDVTFRNKLVRALAEAGYDHNGLTGKLAELLQARQHGLTKDGNVVDMGPDAHAQNKTMDMILKVTDAYPNPKLDVNASINAQVVILGSDALPVGNPLDAPYIDSEAIDVTPQ